MTTRRMFQMMPRTSTDVHSKLTISQDVQIFIGNIFTQQDIVKRRLRVPTSRDSFLFFLPDFIGIRRMGFLIGILKSSTEMCSVAKGHLLRSSATAKGENLSGFHGFVIRFYQSAVPTDFIGTIF